MDDKRYIDNSPFSEKKSIEEFKEIFALNFFHFDESGILTKNECPMCSGCGKGFIDPKLPDLAIEEGLMKLKASKKRMSDYFEIHIQKEINLKLEEEKQKIAKEIRKKYGVN